MAYLPRKSSYWLGFRSAWVYAGIAALFAGCASPPPPVAIQLPVEPEPFQPVVVAPPPAPLGKVSGARTPKDYRQDAAAHLYELHGPRIFTGKLPPLLYAVGVLQVEIDGKGHVLSTSWMRKPSHAPEVVSEIESKIRSASPFPAPAKMGRVTYTDTWLWHKSGQFQLDTLTEGQL